MKDYFTVYLEIKFDDDWTINHTTANPGICRSYSRVEWAHGMRERADTQHKLKHILESVVEKLCGIFVASRHHWIWSWGRIGW